MKSITVIHLTVLISKTSHDLHAGSHVILYNMYRQVNYAMVHEISLIYSVHKLSTSSINGGFWAAL